MRAVSHPSPGLRHQPNCDISRTPWSLAYLPEGPSVDWLGDRPITDFTEPLVAHLKARKAFTVKMGPPVVIRRWDAGAGGCALD